MRAYRPVPTGVMIAPFAITELLPICTPLRIFMFERIITFSPISTLASRGLPSFRRSGCVS